MTKCVLCGMDVDEKKIKKVQIKGKTKSVCKGCVTAIKGLA